MTQSHTRLGQACLQAWHYSESSQAGTVIHGFLPPLQSSILPPSHPYSMLLYNAIHHIVFIFHQHIQLCIWHMNAPQSAGSHTYSPGVFPSQSLVECSIYNDMHPHTPVRHLPIRLDLLSKLCTLSSSLGLLAQAMKVCLTFVFFGMLCQSNLAPTSSATFDPSWHAHWGDFPISLLGLLLAVRWTKTVQLVCNAPVIPIAHVMGHPADPVQAYQDLLAASPTTHPNQPLLTFNSGGSRMAVIIPMLVSSLNILLEALLMDTSLYSLHILHKGGATAAYRGGTDQIDIKRYGLSASDAFSSLSPPLVLLPPWCQQHWQHP